MAVEDNANVEGQFSKTSSARDSMARSITSLGAMILWEEGKFQLDDPISRYLPQFADQRVFAELERVTADLQAHIDAGHIAGAVGAVVRDGQLVYMEALGQADIEAARPMPEDAIFRLYSMARSITSLGAMILWEEGKFQLDDPISRYLPQFADQRVFADARTGRDDSVGGG